jgi:hypothetical protein
VTGGKQGLLSELIATWATSPLIEATLGLVRASRDPVAIVHVVASSSRQAMEQFADIIRVMLTTAPHDAAVAEQMDKVTSQVRAGLMLVAERLDQLGALRQGMDVAQAVDVLWFYLGYVSFITLHDDNGWSYERAERWLAEQASRELLSRTPRRSKGSRRSIALHPIR